MRTSPQSQETINGTTHMRLLEKTNTSINNNMVSFRFSKPDKEATEIHPRFGENSFSSISHMLLSSKSLLSPTTKTPTRSSTPKQKLMLSSSRTTPKKKLPRIPGLWGNSSYSNMMDDTGAEEEEKSWEFQLAEMLEKTSLKHHTSSNNNNNNSDWTESNATLETCDESEISDDSGRLTSSSGMLWSPSHQRGKLDQSPHHSPYYQKRRDFQKKKLAVSLSSSLSPRKKPKFTINENKGGGTVWVHSSATAAPHLELNIVTMEAYPTLPLGSNRSTRSSLSTATTSPRKRRGRRAISNRRTLDNTVRCY